ncbi:MAG: hypothetical protein ACJ8D1_17395, partial [Microvirga sp.]
MAGLVPAIPISKSAAFQSIGITDTRPVMTWWNTVDEGEDTEMPSVSSHQGSRRAADRNSSAAADFLHGQR